MLKKFRRLVVIIVVLAIAWPPVSANAQILLKTEAPLFDSVDENFNPVSMSDKINGKPLVFAVSSCS